MEKNIFRHLTAPEKDRIDNTDLKPDSKRPKVFHKYLITQNSKTLIFIQFLSLTREVISIKKTKLHLLIQRLRIFLNSIHRSK
jgi:hypothetical protein